MAAASAAWPDVVSSSVSPPSPSAGTAADSLDGGLRSRPRLMAPLLLYATCAVGAIGLYLMLRPEARSVKAVGALLGFSAIAYLGVRLALSADVAAGLALREFPIFVAIFAGIAVAAAGRMITHPRPVYCALYFVLVVIASAGLFLMLQAEFMAFALIIVYAGAILITYLFVLMLAQQAESEDDLRTLAEYDRVPREPATAVLVGLVMVAVLGDALFGRTADNLMRPGQPWPTEAIAEGVAREWAALDAMPRARDAAIEAVAPGFTEIVRTPMGDAITVHDGRAFVTVVDAAGLRQEIELPDSARPGNTQRVGLVLVSSFPVSLELAGVILTMAMFGAVVLARRQAEIGEDRRRDVALRGPAGGLPEAPAEGGRS